MSATDSTGPGVSRKELEEQQKSQGQGYWAIVWRQLKKNVPGMAGLVIIFIIVITALVSPLLANDRPIAAKLNGNRVYPAFATYVDVWVPWQTMRDDLKSWEMTDRFFPLSDFYADLDDKSWKTARDEGRLEWSVWPLVEFNPQQIDKEAPKVRPSSTHLLGTDNQGRDVLARVIHGCVVAILVGVIAMGVATSIGVFLGVIAGYFGGFVDMVLSRITEVVICFPAFFLIIAVISFLPPSIVNIMLVIGLVRWTGIFRLIRGEVLRVKGMDYVISARALGIPTMSIMFRHVLANTIAPIFVSVAFGIAGAVLIESSLSFLGFGDVTVPSWGEIISQGRRYIGAGLTHLVVWPGIAVFVTLTGFNLFGQGLRDAMDPRLRH